MRTLLILISALFISCEAKPAQSSGEPASTDAGAGEEISASTSEFPRREGESPETSNAPDGTRIAHQQMTQKAPTELQEALLERVKTLPGVYIDRSYVSVPGARAFHLEREFAKGPREAFAARTEFGHLHPPHDGSLHLNPDPELRMKIIEAGWAEPHPRSNRTVMVYGPRDEIELEVVWRIVRRAYERATGG